MSLRGYIDTFTSSFLSPIFPFPSFPPSFLLSLIGLIGTIAAKPSLPTAFKEALRLI